MDVKKTLFIKSLENHQKLIDIILQHKNEKGICEVSKRELSVAMNCSLTLINKWIIQVNREDICIETVGRNKYIVHYESLIDQGVFNIIWKMLICTMEDVSLLDCTEEELMQKFKCTRKTVQMYKAYCTTGWIKGTK